MKKKQLNHQVVALIVLVLSALLFVLLTMPFRLKLAGVSEITDMRPNAAITPVLGLIFGFPAALGCGIGNLICDLFSGYGVSYSVFSLIQQLVYGMVPYFLWKRVNKEHDGSEFRLDSISRVLKFCLVMLIDAFLIVLFTGLVNHAYSVTALISADNLYLFLNSFDSGILFGCPLLILGHFLQRYFEKLKKNSDEKIFTFSLNERMILNTILTGLGICVLVGASIYLTDKFGESTDKVGLWGQMYLFETLAMNIYFILSIGMMWFTEKRIARPIEGLAEITQNYYAEHATEEQRKKMISACERFATDNTEVGDLARSYIAMAEDLETYVQNLQNITAEKERINAELSLASDIQSHMLPCIFPAFPDHDEIDIYATMNTAKEVGGDFYDFFMTDNTHVAFVMADVSGKGVPAALFMVIAKTLIKNHAQLGIPVNDVFTSVNKRLCEGNDADLFVTAWLGILDLTNGELQFVNAGHNPPLICQNGEFRYLKAPAGFVLAGIDEFVYKKNVITMQPGDRVFLYTDGVTEATNLVEELYGEKRLKDFLNQRKGDSAEEVLHKLKEDIDEFVGEAPQFDDITMLMLDFKKMM